VDSSFRRDRLTWVAYVMLAWFAFLQASPGLFVPHLRDELDLSYAVGGLHVAAFAAGSMLAGLVSSRLDQALGRRRLVWGSSAVLVAGTTGLVAGDTVQVTIGSVLVMGVGGGLLLATIQAALADHHGARSTVALTEANVAASVAYVVLIGSFALAAALDLDWRTALVASFLVPVLTWWASRGVVIDVGAAQDTGPARLPAAFWVAAGVLVCVTAAEWCVTAWGATFVDDVVGVSTDTAITLMGAYFAGVVLGRVLGSRLARRHHPARLLAVALVVTAVGFGVFWPSTAPAQAVVGLGLLGVGLGNLFPMALSLAVSVAPGRAGPASGRAVTMTSLAVLLAPLTVGALADATSLKSALGVVPVMLALAALGLVLVRRTARSAVVSPG
jgi:MFS family permease